MQNSKKIGLEKMGRNPIKESTQTNKRPEQAEVNNKN